MKIKQYQVDAFAQRPFEGNPAAVCPLDAWLDDCTMQAIAAENNLSETAFFVPLDNGFHLRWFTPLREVELCGHATLASAYIVFNRLGYDRDRVTFITQSGPLTVCQRGDQLEMDFPSQPPIPSECPASLAQGLGIPPMEVWVSQDYLAVFDREETIRSLEPNLTLLGQLDRRGVIVTAPGNEVDFVSRFFAPKFGIPEDPVTGSAHCALTPYWAKRLTKTTLIARQVSQRGGVIGCELQSDRVLLLGSAVIFGEGEILGVA